MDLKREAAPTPAAAAPRRGYAVLWFLGGLIIFIASTVVLLITNHGQVDDATLPIIQCDLRAVYAADANNVWVAGNNLLIAHSTDGGVTWRKARVITKAANAGYSSTATDTTATTARTTTTTTGSTSPSKKRARAASSQQKRQPGLLPNSAAGPNAAPTVDDSKNQQQQSQSPPSVSNPKKPLLLGLLSMLETRSYAAGKDENLEHENLVAIGFNTEGIGLAVGAGGGLYSSTDGGNVWQYEKNVRGSMIQAACIFENAVWYVAVGDNAVVIGGDGAPSDNFYGIDNFKPVAMYVYRVSGPVLKAVEGRGQENMVLITADGHRYETSFNGSDSHGWGKGDQISGVAVNGFTGTATLGIAVGKGGVIAGDRIQAVSPTKQDLYGVSFANATTGWVVGNRGTVLKTTDGAKTWHRVTRESQFTEAAAGSTTPSLPKWYFFVNALSVYAFVHVRSLRAKELTAKPEEWIEPTGETDRPLEPDDIEARNLMPLAKTLADFLRNTETKPPLTVAITGTWGSGKSSLMNLVRTNLMKAGWRPVWFNAWHHQKEDSLLAALLQTIRMQAVPKLWNRGGPSFYAHLMAIRLRHYLAHFIALLMLVAFSIGFIVGYPLLIERMSAHSEKGHDLVSLVLDYIPPGAARLFLLIASVVSVVYSLIKTLSAFGVKPAQLLTKVSSGARIKDLERQTSFRERFSREFSEVTEALSPKRTMLIFIDDLDRCRPENVVDVLEAVNFLVSSGTCFVVLGMARDKVQPAVGLAFEKMAAEMETPENAGATTPEQAARARRQQLARDYLDKLINIEVPVPRMSTDESLRALISEKKEQERPWWSIDPLHAASLAIVTAILLLLPLSMLFTGVETATFVAVAHTNHEIQYINNPAPRPARPATLTTGTNDAATATAAAATATVPATDRTKIASDQPARIIDAGTVHDTLMYWPSFAVLLLLLWILGWLVTSAEEEIVRDSDEFTRALEIWHPFLYEELPTPRALKRFKNRVRFMALRSRAQQSEVHEHAIVAIAAIRLQWRSVAAAEEASKTPSTFAEAFKLHASKFGMEAVASAQSSFDDFFAEVRFN